MTVEAYYTEPPTPDTPLALVGNLEAVVDLEASHQGREELREAVRALFAQTRSVQASRAEPDLIGQDQICRALEHDIRHRPDQIPAMLSAVQAAAKGPTKQVASERKILDRAAWLDLFDHGLRHFGILPDLSVEEAAVRVEANRLRSNQGLPPETSLRKLGHRIVKFLKKEGLL